MGGFGRDPIPGLRAGPSPAAPATVQDAGAALELRVLSGPCAGRLFPISPPRSTIGRSDPPSANVDIDLGDCETGTPPMVSRMHAELIWIDGKLHVVDLGSRNGTWVGDHRLAAGPQGISEPAEVAPGVRIRLANLEAEIAGPPTAVADR